jgi:hypothetical protein
VTIANVLTAVGLLVRDTFRQSLAYGIFWILLGVSAVCILFCASVSVEGAVPIHRQGENPDFLPRGDEEIAKIPGTGVDVVSGELSMVFGAFKAPLGRDRRDAVGFLQLALAGGVADTMGLLLTLTWTAGFLPGFLEDRAVAVLLAKPAPRWLLLLGKYIGVLAFVLLHSLIFVVGTWAALGLRTDVWDLAYLWTIPILLLHFGIFFSFSVLLAVLTRSTIACVFGSVAFWFLCWGMNYGRHVALAEIYADPKSPMAGPLVRVVDVGYWLLPKPADLGILLYDALGAGKSFGKIDAFVQVQQHGDFWPVASVLASSAFLAAALAAAVYDFVHTDY